MLPGILGVGVGLGLSELLGHLGIKGLLMGKLRLLWILGLLGILGLVGLRR